MAGELATARREFEARLALSSKAVDETAQLKKTSEAATAELQQATDSRDGGPTGHGAP